MQGIYEKNMAAYLEAYPVSRKKVERLFLHSKNNIFWDQAYDGTPIMYIKTEDGKVNYFFGKYNPEAYIDERIKALGQIEEGAPIVVFGMGNVSHIRKLLDVTKSKCPIVVYEPSIEIFKAVMEGIDISDLFDGYPLALCVEEINGDSVLPVVEKTIDYQHLFVMKFYQSPQYEKFYGEKIKDVIDQIKRHVEGKIVSANTRERFTNVYGDNTINNLRHLYNGYNYAQFKDCLKGEIPAIVVSAGPSLNKNIEVLKQAKGKACIIAVDTAIKPLLNRGIVPDFFAIVDGLKPTELIEHPGVHDIPLLTCAVVAKGVMDYHKGKKIFTASGSAMETYFLKKARQASLRKKDTVMGDLATGGSVACTAFSFAVWMGASEVILVGQDLALTNNKTHADGTFQKKMPKIAEAEIANGLFVPGINGKMVPTRYDFLHYHKWFENEIKSVDVKVIDATQGGARIKGTKVMSLQRALDTYCKQEIDLVDVWAKIPEMFDQRAKKSFVEEYNNMPKQMKRVASKANKAQKMYANIIKRVTEGATDEEFAELLTELGELNEFFANDDHAKYVSENLRKMEKLIRANLYNGADSVEEERILLLRQGEVFCNQMTYVAKVIQKVAEKMLEEDPFEYVETETFEALELMQMELEKAKVR